MEYKFLNDRQVEEMQMMAEIINEMAVADGFLNLDVCLEKNPNHLETYNRYASAAIRAVRRVQGKSVQVVINEIDDPEGG